MSSAAEDEIDSIFAHIASKQKGLEPLLNAFFGFLKRKTDFYMTYPEGSAHSPAGFPPGVAEAMVHKAMMKYSFAAVPASTSGNSAMTSSSSTQAKEAKAKEVKAPSLYTETGKLVPIGNGGVGRNGMYYWTQTLNELTLYVDLPTGTKGNTQGSRIFQYNALKYAHVKYSEGY